MNILITGSKGFSGRFLTQYMKTLPQTNLYSTDIATLAEHQYITADLSNADSAVLVLEQSSPAQIYHMVGSFSNHYETDYQINMLTTKNLLDAVLRLQIDCRVLLVGSAAEYGIPSALANPIAEDFPLNPVSIYGLTKVYQYYLMKTYLNLYPLSISMVRPFNLLGKGLSPRLFVGNVYKQIDEVKRNERSTIELGNLEGYRDYIPIEDAVRLYHLVMEKGISGDVYHVARGTTIKIEDLLKQILQEEGIDYSIVRSKIIDNPLKKDVSRICANIDKIKNLQDS